jgi:hypothetical protein
VQYLPQDWEIALMGHWRNVCINNFQSSTKSVSKFNSKKTTRKYRNPNHLAPKSLLRSAMLLPNDLSRAAFTGALAPALELELAADASSF